MTDEDLESSFYWQERAEAAERRIAELEKLAYLGDHHFPDLTYKARLEEAVQDLRSAELRIAELEETYDRVQRYPTRDDVCTACGSLWARCQCETGKPAHQSALHNVLAAMWIFARAKGNEGGQQTRQKSAREMVEHFAYELEAALSNNRCWFDGNPRPCPHHDR